MHPYTIIILGWITLGICTSIASAHSFWRVVFISSAWLTVENSWYYLRQYLKSICTGQGDLAWCIVKVRIVSYAKPLFHLWLATLTYHVLWYGTGNVDLTENTILMGYIQSASILVCVLISFWTRAIECAPRRGFLKWLLLGLAFSIPPSRDPWYEESVVVQQTRWIVMAFLFVIQSFESYASSNQERRHIEDLYILRIGWVVLVHPLFLVFTAVCCMYYAITMIKIHVVIPGYDPEKGYNQNMSYGNMYQPAIPTGATSIPMQDYGLAHLMGGTNTNPIPEERPNWQRFTQQRWT